VALLLALNREASLIPESIAPAGAQNKEEKGGVARAGLPRARAPGLQINRACGTGAGRMANHGRPSGWQGHGAASGGGRTPEVVQR